MKTQVMSAEQEAFRPTKDQVVEFLDTQVLGTLSTITESGQPQGATVAFSQTPELEFIVGTDIGSRKSINMQNDEHVALTVTDGERRFTVQAEGRARMLGAKAFETTYATGHYNKLPASLPFKDVEGQVHFLITPSYVRFSDCNPHPWVVTEFNFD